MELTATITLAGIGGLAGIIILSGVFLYEKESTIGLILILVGIILAVAIIAVELNNRAKDAQSRRIEAEAKAEWAPFIH